MAVEDRGRALDSPAVNPHETEPRAGRRFQWEDLIDGRLHRLRRGVDYTGSIKALAEDAQNTATLLGKVAATYKEELGRYESLWVQFLDGKLQIGDPCPRCGGRSLERVQGYFLRCHSCQAVYALSSTSAKATELRAEASRVKAIVRGKFRAPEDERFSLQSYSAIEFLASLRESRREHFFGRAVDPTGMPVLLWARCSTARLQGDDDPETEAEPGDASARAPRGQWRICRWPVAPFGSLIRLDRVPAPRSGDDGEKAHGSRNKRGRRLRFFSEVRLLHEENLPGRERFFGHAIDAQGEPRLIYVDYPLINGARVKDPDEPGGEVHTVYHWPVEAFGPMIELGSLQGPGG